MSPIGASAALLDAVASSGLAWEKWLADQADYEGRFPDAALTEPEVEHEFLGRFASRLGRRVATGEAHEIGRRFGALEPILERGMNPRPGQVAAGRAAAVSPQTPPAIRTEPRPGRGVGVRRAVPDVGRRECRTAGARGCTTKPGMTPSCR